MSENNKKEKAQDPNKAEKKSKEAQTNRIIVPDGPDPDPGGDA